MKINNQLKNTIGKKLTVDKRNLSSKQINV